MASVRTLSGSPNVTVCSCVGLGLGIGFREWVPIRNIFAVALLEHRAQSYSDDVWATAKRLWRQSAINLRVAYLFFAVALCICMNLM